MNSGPAVRIAGIIERIDADEDVPRPARLGEAQREAEEDRVARGHVGDRDAVARRHPSALRCRSVSAEPPNARRSSGRTMCRSASSAAIARAAFELDAVALAVIDRQRDDGKARLAREPRADHRVRARPTAGRPHSCSQLEPEPGRRPEHQRVERERSATTIAMLSPEPEPLNGSAAGSAMNNGSDGMNEPDGAHRQLGDSLRRRRVSRHSQSIASSEVSGSDATSPPQPG